MPKESPLDAMLGLMGFDPPGGGADHRYVDQNFFWPPPSYSEMDRGLPVVSPEPQTPANPLHYMGLIGTMLKGLQDRTVNPPERTIPDASMAPAHGKIIKNKPSVPRTRGVG